MRILTELALALVLATAADLGLAAGRGYALRFDAVRLAVLDGALLAVAVIPVFAVLQILRRSHPGSRWLGRTPWFCVLLSAWAPLALVRHKNAPDFGGLAFWATALAVIVGVWVLERRTETVHGRGLAMTAVGLGALAVTAFVLTHTLPGARQLPAGSTDRGSIPASPERPNLILIVLDTLRADHLGLYGYPRETSPWLDALAESSTVFDRAVAASSYTLPSHATLFTGLYPASHGADVVEKGEGISLDQLGLHADVAPVSPLSDEAVTLAELARTGGLATGAVCANSAYLSRHFNLDQGFDTYVDGHLVRDSARPVGLWIGGRFLARRSWRFARLLQSHERYYLLASEVNRLALDWIEPRRDRRFFLFLNYMDPHAPYLPVGSYRRLFPQAYARQEVDVEAIRSGRPILEEEHGPLVDAYDAEIRYLDDRLAELFGRLESWDLLDSTLVVLVGDHGESFGEHGKFGHAVGVYEPEVRIPLVVRRPGQEEGRHVDRFVHLVDVLPTVLEELRLPVPEGLEGRSLFARERDDPVMATLGCYERDYAEDALYRDPWKLIRRSGGEIELYDLRQDPEETRDLSTLEPGVAAELASDLERFKSEVRPRFQPVGVELDEEIRKRLRALGYLQ